MASYESKDFFTMDDFDVEGKTVLLRVDVNSPTIYGRVVMNGRIEENAKTIRELSDRKAKVVVLLIKVVWVAPISSLWSSMRVC